MSHTCTTCYMTLSSSSHLRRHERLHFDQKQHACPFCNKYFLRSDAARRHSKTCQNRGAKLLPIELKRGRKAQSCTSCALAKSRCDADIPCQRCANKGLDCSYRRQSSDLSDSAVSYASLMDSSGANSTGELVGQDVTPIQKSTKIPVSWLLNFTDPGKHSLPEYFGSTSGTPPHEEIRDTDCDASFGSDFSTLINQESWHSWPLALDGGQILHDPLIIGTRSWEIALDDSLTSHSLPGPSALDQRATELASCLETLGLSVESKAAIFGQGKLSTFVQSYFDCWHRHCPILHRPSFCPESAHIVLLLAVSLVGVVYHSEISAKMVRECVHVAEKYIFEHEGFKRLLGVRPSEVEVYSRDGLQILQAAFTLCLINNWGTSLESRRQMRVHRYPQLVAAARYLRLPATTQERYDLPVLESDWRAWVDREERIRLATYIFLVDTSHAIFHRMPPRMTNAEMTGSLPSREELFNAPAIVEFNCLYNAPLSLPLNRYISALFGPSVNVHTFGSLTILNLFELIHAIHNVMFSARVTCSLHIIKPSLTQALANWKVLWDHLLPRQSEREKELLGFFQNAPEYWVLANIFLRAESDNAAPEYVEPLDVDSMGHINELLKSFSQLAV